MSNMDDEQHNKEMIQSYQHKFDEASILAEESIKRQDITQAIFHLQIARHAKDLIRMEKDRQDK
jgi:hypothetical protein